MHVPHSGSQIDLFSEGQPRDKGARLRIGVCPVTCAFSPWRRVFGRGGLVELGPAVGQSIGGIGVGAVRELDL